MKARSKVYNSACNFLLKTVFCSRQVRVLLHQVAHVLALGAPLFHLLYKFEFRVIKTDLVES